MPPLMAVRPRGVRTSPRRGAVGGNRHPRRRPRQNVCSAPAPFAGRAQRTSGARPSADRGICLSDRPFAAGIGGSAASARRWLSRGISSRAWQLSHSTVSGLPRAPSNTVASSDLSPRGAKSAPSQLPPTRYPRISGRPAVAHAPPRSRASPRPNHGSRRGR